VWQPYKPIATPDPSSPLAGLPRALDSRHQTPGTRLLACGLRLSQWHTTQVLGKESHQQPEAEQIPAVMTLVKAPNRDSEENQSATAPPILAVLQPSHDLAVLHSILYRRLSLSLPTWSLT